MMDVAEDREATLSEIVIESAESMLQRMSGRTMAGVVVASQVLPNGKTATVWRFINCPDPEVGAKALRQIADMIEGKLGDIEVPS